MAMPTVAIKSLLPALVLDLPQVPALLAMDRLREAVRTFCELSHYWRETLVITPVDGQTEYPLAIPAGTSPVEVRSASQGGDNVAFSMADASTIQLDDITGDPVTVVVAVKPSAAGEVIYQALAEEYQDAITSGARARLLMIPNKPWSMPEMTGAYWDLFTTGTNKARRQVENEFRTSCGDRATVRQVFY